MDDALIFPAVFLNVSNESYSITGVYISLWLGLFFSNWKEPFNVHSAFQSPAWL